MVTTLKANTLGGGGGGGGSSPDIVAIKGSVSSVPLNATQTIVSKVVAVGFSFKLTGVIATGTVAAEFYVYDDATELYRARTSTENRTFEFTHNPIVIASGHTLSVKVAWNDPSVIGGTQNFEASILGYDV